MDYLTVCFADLRCRNIPRISNIGKITDSAMPIRRLSPAAEDTKPTKVGALVQPRSPARASMAKSAVPPLGMPSAARLNTPGHMMPTENPHMPHPTRESIGLGETEVAI